MGSQPVLRGRNMSGGNAQGDGDHRKCVRGAGHCRIGKIQRIVQAVPKVSGELSVGRAALLNVRQCYQVIYPEAGALAPNEARGGGGGGGGLACAKRREVLRLLGGSLFEIRSSQSVHALPLRPAFFQS